MSEKRILLKTKRKYYRAIIRMQSTIKLLIEFIETCVEYSPISKEYQMKWLALIDEELEKGQTEASFWKNKIRKY